MRKEKNICYKVVAKNNSGKYTSAIVFKNAEVVYQIGEWVNAPLWLRKRGYHLLAFDDEIRAKEFRFYNTGLVVFRAEYENKIIELPPLCFVHVVSQEKCLLEKDFPWPRGTIMVEKIKLLEEVKLDEI